MGIKPDDSAIATLIVQYGQAKQLEQAQELFESASAFFPEGANVYNAMVDAFCKCGKTEDAYHLFMEMADQGSNRDAVTVSILVTHLTKHGKGFFFICTCSIALFSCFLLCIQFFLNGHGYCHRQGNFKRLKTSYMAVSKMKFSSTLSCTILLSSQCLSQVWLTYSPIHQIGKQNFWLQGIIANFCFFSFQAGKLHSAISIYDRMISSGISQSMQTFNLMIR